MNKTLLSAALFAATAAFVVAPGAARAADGQINFAGEVTAQTCQITGTPGAAGAPVTLPTVTLPTVSSLALATNGATTGNTPFQIQITGCDPARKSVTALFSGSTIDTSTGALRNTAANGAKNVELQLLNADATPLALDRNTVAGQGSKSAQLISGKATLYYIARYQARGAATAGPVESSVQFTMIYQ